MSEHPPAPKKRHPEQAGFEANVRLPQTFTAVKLVKLLENLEAFGPEATIDRLAHPEPLDEETLERMAVKANAQHALHGIPETVLPEQIQDTLRRANTQSLYLLGGMFGVAPSLGVTFEDDIESIREKALACGQHTFIKDLIRGVTEELDSPEVKELALKFKAEYTNWDTKDEQERKRSDRGSDIFLSSIISRLISRARKVFEATPGTQDEKNEQRVLLENFARAIRVEEV